MTTFNRYVSASELSRHLAWGTMLLGQLQDTRPTDQDFADRLNSWNEWEASWFGFENGRLVKAAKAFQSMMMTRCINIDADMKDLRFDNDIREHG